MSQEKIDRIGRINGRIHRSLSLSRQQKLLKEKKEIIFGEPEDVGSKWRGRSVVKDGVNYFEMWLK